MELITNELIFLDVLLPTKDSVLQYIASILSDNGRVNDQQAYLESLYEREAIAPTNIGFSVAIPHGKTSAVSYPSLIFLRLKEPIVWNGEDVHIIFGIAVPSSAQHDIHLKMLQRVARKIMNEEVRDIFSQATSRDEILRQILA